MVDNALPRMAQEDLENTATFREVVTSRRSVRAFNDSPVAEDVVNDCIDLALLAPNSSNLQPWEFYWVRSPEKKTALVQCCLSQPAARTAAELIVIVGRTRTWRRHNKEMLARLARNDKTPKSAIDYYTTIVPIAYTQGPLSIIGFGKRIAFFLRGLFTPTPREPTSQSHMRLWAMKSASLACENLMLAFRSHGFDTCPMEGFDSRRLRKLLGLPRDAVICMVIGAGKRAPHGVYGQQIRFNRDWFVKEV